MRPANRLGLCTAVVALSILDPMPVLGSLPGGLPLSDLIADSDLIVQAMWVQEGTRRPTTKALERFEVVDFAVLRVERVFKGRYERDTVKGTYVPDTLTIEFMPEIHEQFIRSRARVLLFLKKTPEGTYTGTQYGRSYWPLTYVGGAEKKLCTPYVHPITLMVMPETLLKEAEVVCELGMPHRVKAIYLEDVIPLLGVEQ